MYVGHIFDSFGNNKNPNEQHLPNIICSDITERNLSNAATITKFRWIMFGWMYHDDVAMQTKINLKHGLSRQETISGDTHSCRRSAGRCYMSLVSSSPTGQRKQMIQCHLLWSRGNIECPCRFTIHWFSGVKTIYHHFMFKHTDGTTLNIARKKEQWVPNWS